MTSIPTLRGRAASPVRPGLVVKSVLLGQTPLATGELVFEAAIVELHGAYKELVRQENDLRPRARRLKPMTAYSFKTLFKFAQLLNLVELVREEPMQFPPPGGNLLQIRKPNGEPYVVVSVRRVFKLTAIGAEDEKSWTNLCRAWIDKWPAPQAAEYLPPTMPGRPRREEVVEEPKVTTFTPYKWKARFSATNLTSLIEHLEMLSELGVDSPGVTDELTLLSGRVAGWIIEAEESYDEVKSIGYTAEMERFQGIIAGLTALREALLDHNISGSVAILAELVSGS